MITAIFPLEDTNKIRDQRFSSTKMIKIGFNAVNLMKNAKS